MANLQVEAAPNSQNIIGHITIKAPLNKVFEAHVKEDLFKQWWGKGNTTIKTFKAEDGGQWHTTETTDQGSFEFKGCFHEVSHNERIIWTFEFLGLPERGHVALERMEFKAIDDQTTQIVTTSTYQSVEDRDNMIAYGMEEGWREALDSIEKIAAQA